jgi:hypothetical protein
MYFVALGFYGFFVLAGLRGHVEPHWTVAATIPVMVQVMKFGYPHTFIRKSLWIGAVVAWILIIGLRVGLIIDFIPQNTIEVRFHQAREMSRNLEELAGEKPVVFVNSYGKAAQYTFYTSRVAHSYNTVRYRRNQYDLWPIETKLQGRPVFFIDNGNKSLPSYTVSPKFTFHAAEIKNFESYQKLSVHFPDTALQAFAGSQLVLPVEITNPYPYVYRVNDPDVRYEALFFQDGQLNKKTLASIESTTGEILPDDVIQARAVIKIPEKSGEYYLGLSVVTGMLPPTFNSNRVQLSITKP